MGNLGEPLERDPSGNPALGIQSTSTGYLIAAKGDSVTGGTNVCLYRWNTSTLAWERWDGKMDTVVSGDLIVAVDGLETLVAATNTALGTVNTNLGTINGNITDVESAINDTKDKIDLTNDFLSSTQDDYKLSDWLVSGTDVYIGYLRANGAWIIKKVSTVTGQVRYISGASGYSFADPASLSYDLFSAEF